MSLFDRFRQPEWKSADPVVRSAAIRRLGPDDHEVLVGVVRTEADAAIRRLAARKLADPVVLAEVARGDQDEGVREVAAEALAALAVSTLDANVGEAALVGLDQSRELLRVARDAVLARVRLGAVARLSSPRALSTVARTSADAETRHAALVRIVDDPTLAEVASRSEHKDIALAAVERIAHTDALQTVASRAKNKAAARRARIRFEALVPPPARAPERAAPEPETEAPAGDAAAPVEVLALHQPGEDAGEAVASLAEAAPAAATPAVAAPAPAEPLPEPTAEEREAQRAEAEALCAAYEEAAALENAKDARQRFGALDKTWSGLKRSGAVTEELAARRAAAEKQVAARAAADRETREKAATENKARLETLCQRVEALAAAAEPGLRESERALRESRAALAQPGHLPSKREADELGARLKAARALLYGKVQEQKETDEWKRWANLGIQEELCQRAEALLAVTDMPRASRELRDLDEKWKQASQAPRDQASTLWTRFKTARDQVRARCDAHFAAESKEREGNQKRKEALCVEAESLSESTDWVKTAERLQALQADWQTIGPVPRQHARPLWERFRGACNKFFVRRKDDRSTRAGERSRNLERKEALCAAAEALAETVDWDKGAAEVKRLQAEWKTIGPVRKDKSEVVWQRFRTACDHFFERYKGRHDVEAQARLAAREAIGARLEALLPTAGAEDAPAAEAPADLLEQVRKAQADWRDSPGATGPRGAELERRFQGAVQKLVTAFPEPFRGSDLDPESGRRKMEELCATVEALAGEKDAAPTEASPAMLLAQQWREALASNTMRGRTEEPAAKRGAKDKVEAAQAAWKRLPPVPGDAGRLLQERFQKACRRALAAH